MSDKKVFVTGASRGMELLIRAALAAGHAVVASGRQTTFR
jgi:NAD(P)-dependent dehydrogenase (short-subunit alcohol dehydrogenase family)